MQKDDVASRHQTTAYRTIIGQMLYVVRLSAPLVLVHASIDAAKQADLFVHHLRTLASNILKLQKQYATLRFLSPNRAHPATTSYVLDSISDGATAPAHATHGREGHIMFKRFGSIIHPIQWVHPPWLASYVTYREVARQPSFSLPLTPYLTNHTYVPSSKISPANHLPRT